MSLEVQVKSNLFADLAIKLHENADKIASDTADRVVKRAESLVPVDSGDLFLSIRKEPNEQDGSTEYAVVAGKLDEGIDYAVYVEYGTSSQAAQPFMTPAAELEKVNFEDAAAGIL